MTALHAEPLRTIDRTISPTPDVRIVDVSPEMAAYWLEARNLHNRKTRPSRIDTYAGEMARGEWQFNGDTIRFDINGTLLDGQHRLMALVRARVTLPFVLAVGLPPQSQDTMDQGASRTTGNVLQLRGVTDPNNIAATAQLCWGYVNNTLGRKQGMARRGSLSQVLAFVDEHGESLDTAIRQGRALRKMIPARISTASAAYWIIAQAAPDRASVFWGPLMDGADLTENSPIRVLRNRLIREAMVPRKAETRALLAAYIKGWNAWLEDRTISLLVWKDNEPFPRATEVARRQGDDDV